MTIEVYICVNKKRRKKLSLNIGATLVGHGCQTPVNKTKEKFHKFIKKKKKNKTSLIYYQCFNRYI